MGESMNDKDRAIALFEERGVDWVREQYETQRFSAFKERLATHWLAQHGRAERVASERAANDLASAASRKADNANTIATLALIATVITIAPSALLSPS